MITNYIKTAWRNLLRDKRTLAINILGLSVGIAAAFLLFTVIRFETSYDTFHANAKRIYRVVTADRFENGMQYNPGVPNPVPEALKLDLPNLEQVAVVQKYENCQFTLMDTPSGQPDKFKEEAIFFIEPAFFDLFDAQWLAGDPSALNDPGTVVLDRAVATKFFGNWHNATGQTVIAENALPLKVVGVIESLPPHTNLPLSVIISFATVKAHADLLNYDPTNWGGTSSFFQTYVLLDDRTSAAEIDKQLEAFCAKHYKNVGISKKSHHLQALSDIHFDTRFEPLHGRVVRRATIDTLILIGIIIVLMASVNFVNIATAQSITRSKEIGVRKAMGANRRQLIAYALSETLLLVTCSTLLAIILAWLCMPLLKHVADVPETIRLFTTDTLKFAIVVIAAVTLVAGSYPALILSGFKPALALKSKISTTTVGGVPLRRTLVVFQFAIAQILVVSMLIAHRQLAFVQDAELGFDKEAVYYVNLPWNDRQSRAIEVFKQELLQLPAVQSASFSTDVPSSENNSSSNFYFDNRNENAPFYTFLKFADADYFDTYGMQFVAGKAFHPSDTMYEAVVNETLLHKLGIQDMETAVGKTIRIGWNSPWMSITGVVKDFTTNSLRETVKPLVITPHREWYSLAGIKLNTSSTRQTLAAIQEAWENHFPDHVYEGRFLNDSIADFYRQETQLAQIYRIFALLALFISCMGLFGIVSFLTVQKTKEIGIRKVLGASVFHIVRMFATGFVILVTIAVVIASPVAWWVMNRWLEDFAYRIDIEWWMFAAAGIGAVAIALATVGWQAMRAATANPVDSLRDE